MPPMKKISVDFSASEEHNLTQKLEETRREFIAAKGRKPRSRFDPVTLKWRKQYKKEGD